MTWINEPLLTSEQKHQMYIESMEKAMDYGEKVVMSMVEMYRTIIAEKHLSYARQSLSAKALYEALVYTFIVFDEMSLSGAEEAADKYLQFVQWGDE